MRGEFGQTEGLKTGICLNSATGYHSCAVVIHRIEHRWFWKRYAPELYLISSPLERKLCKQPWMLGKKFTALFVLVLVALNVPPLVFLFLATPLVAGHSFLLNALVLWPIASWYGALFILRERYRRVIRREVAALGVPVCKYCGHDLRGRAVSRLGIVRCPKCEHALGQRAIELLHKAGE